MTSEHNPIAQLVTKIQQKWAEEVTPFPSLRIVRFLNTAEESKIYEGFLKLESSEHGKLSEIFITLLTPFKSPAAHCSDLIHSWFDAYDKDKKVFEKLNKNGINFKWDDQYYRQQAVSEDTDTDQLFLEILSSFHAALNMPDRKLVLALAPGTIGSISGYQTWLSSLFRLNLPEKIQFCFFDSKEHRYFDDLFSSADSTFAKTLMLELDVSGAVKKIIQSGNKNIPAVRLNIYIQKMSEAVTEKNLSKLEQVGKECIEDMARTKIKLLMSSAHIAFAGMLFNFRKYDTIEMLLNNGIKIAEAGAKTGDETCKLMIAQFYLFKASNYQLVKKLGEAITWFLKSADAFTASSQLIQSISSYRQAAFLSKSYDPVHYVAIINKGYAVGEKLSKDELAYSDFPFIAYDYYSLASEKGDFARCNEVDDKMKNIFGDSWVDDVEKRLMHLHKKETVL